MCPRIAWGWLHVPYYLGWGMKPKSIVYYLYESLPISECQKTWTHCFWIAHSSKQTWKFCSLGLVRKRCLLLHCLESKICWRSAHQPKLTSTQQTTAESKTTASKQRSLHTAIVSFLKGFFQSSCCSEPWGEEHLGITQTEIQPSELLTPPLSGMNSSSVVDLMAVICFMSLWKEHIPLGIFF